MMHGMPIQMLNGISDMHLQNGVYVESCGCGMSGLGADPVELNKETYRTRRAINAYLIPDLFNNSFRVLHSYKAGEVVGKFIESRTIDNQLYFRSNYGGWLPYEYDNFYFANLKEVELTDAQKQQIVLDSVKKNPVPGTSTTVDILQTTTDAAGNIGDGILDLVAMLGKIGKYLPAIVIVGGAAYLYNQHRLAKKLSPLKGYKKRKRKK